ncbi:hypothetical protein [Rhizosaccharibacter radicis]|uniref:NnrS family protein n=1 Tax=Rhizosaccharibacter radicis TaxID=2782605 RepID=A0ABT1VT20_9PROT|nr:hypothetical protein [Acetobacteraceae bacterium KSS12]
MSRLVPVTGALLATLLAELLLFWAGWSVMPSLCCAFLFLSGLPLGALGVLMGAELSGRGRWSAAPFLRALLPLLPLAALLAIPLLCWQTHLLPPPADARSGFGAAWFSHGAVAARLVGSGLVWALLCLLFAAPPGKARADGRRGAAALGLLCHLLMATLLAFDWIGQMEPRFRSASLGLILLASWSAAALAGALLVRSTYRTAADADGAAGSLSAILLVALAAAVFLQFTQFLVTWSANLPDELVWYRHRAGMAGAAAVWLGLLVCVPVMASMDGAAGRGASGGGSRRPPALLMAAALLVLLSRAMEMFWMVTPAVRGRFTLTLPDAVALLGLVAALGIAVRGAGAAIGRKEPRLARR